MAPSGDPRPIRRRGRTLGRRPGFPRAGKEGIRRSRDSGQAGDRR